jgi:predicted nuclease with TOPRIM domain
MSEKVLLSHQLKEWMEKVESKIVDKDEIAKRNAEFQAKIKSLKEKLSPIISEFEELWLTRSRREGIEQNLNRYEGLKKHYDSLLERLE